MDNYLFKCLAAIRLLIFGVFCTNTVVASRASYDGEAQGQTEHDASCSNLAFGHDGRALLAKIDNSGHSVATPLLFGEFAGFVAAERGGANLLYNYATAPESSFASGLWEGTLWIWLVEFVFISSIGLACDFQRSVGCNYGGMIKIVSGYDVNVVLAKTEIPNQSAGAWLLIINLTEFLSAEGTGARPALPAPSPVDYSWGTLNLPRRYLPKVQCNETTAMEHINYRHAFDSGFSDASRLIREKGDDVKDLSKQFAVQWANGRYWKYIDCNRGRMAVKRFGGCEKFLRFPMIQHYNGLEVL